MKKLKIILLFSLSLILFYRYYSISNYKSIYENKISTIEGIVTNIKTKDNTTSFILKTKENILVKYYDKIKLNVGDIIKVKGEIITPESNRVFNLFNYKKYLLSKKIYKYIQATEIKKIGNSKNFLFTIRRKLDKRLSRINNSYLDALILANNTIDNEIYATYQNNGISHLFAISGMHIAIFSSVLLFIFNKLFINRKISHYLTFILLLIYMFIIFTPSVIRSVLSFIFIKIKKIYNIQISSIQILILICYLMILYNPYYIYDTAFKYSFIISFGLIMFNSLYKDKNYLCKSLLISLLSFVFSFPITINNNFSINLLSPLLNLIFVPMISIILFPLSLITLIIPKLNIITILIFNIFENISIFFDKYSIIINFGYINILTTIIYYIFLYFLLKNIKLYKIILFLIFLFLLNNNTFYDNYRLTVIDQTTPNMIQGLKGIFERNALISRGYSLF